MATFILVVLYVTVFCTGCVTTSKVAVHCDKVVDTRHPIDGNMNVGVRVEFFKDHTKK